MTRRRHHYRVQLEWTGDTGSGTSSYRSYGRDHQLSAAGKAPIAGSADPAFRGDPGRWNPEELLAGSISACHQLWYLHLCAEAGVVVLAYRDDAEGVMEEEVDGSGRFTRVILHPEVVVSATSDTQVALALHERAHAMCFVARSVNFPVKVEAAVRHAGPETAQP